MTMRAALTTIIILASNLGTPTLSAAINAMGLGAKMDAAHQNLTFRVYSMRATRIDLYLFDKPSGSDEVAALSLTEDPASCVWSITVPVASLPPTLAGGATVYYGYRAWGPNWPFNASWAKGSAAGFLSDVDADGNRFNPNKLLLDPYALEISQDPVNLTQQDGSVYASGPDHRLADTGKLAPKGIIVPDLTTSTGTKPQRLLKDDVIYEVHVRGLTKSDASVAANLQGTYAGAALKAGYFKDLGITAVEFLPVQETQNDQDDINPNSTSGANYWGYATLDFFAPDRRYSSDKSPGGPTREFRQMVKTFHDAGIKVFIDVVYNHTGEGYAYNPGDTSTYNLLSWRGLDNPTYYSLTGDRQNSWDNTGTGGNYNTFNPIAQNLIVDSLAYWNNQMGVDGFRFDLASVLGNTCEHGCFHFEKMNPGNALNRIVRALPNATLIAEPWAIGDGTYQVGGFPSGWSEWNGKFRDLLRQSQNKLGVETFITGDLATRFAGSSDLFQNNGRQPWNSINFMVAHDGFTLADLYRFNAKHNNQPFPLGPSDGGNDNNESWDQGGDPVQQRQAARNGLAFLMLSAGVPMITGGDEFLRSLNGNNNPYDLDSVKNWLNFQLTPDQQTFDTYAQRLIAFRASHAALRPATFYSGQAVQWFRPDGGPADNTYFSNPQNHAIAWQIDGTSLQDSCASLFLAYNADSNDVDFVLPSPGNGLNWFRSLDTASWNEGPDTVSKPGAETQITGHYTLKSRAVLALIAR